MSTTDTTYSARFSLPDLIERGRDEVIKCRVYHAGALVAPSAGTVSVYDSSNTAKVDGATVTIAANVAKYTIPSATLSGESLGEGWRVEWSLTMPDSIAHNFRNSAALVRARLYSPITDADLIRVVSGLDPSSSSSITSVSSFQDYLDESHTQIQLRLIEQGRRPNLIMSPSALREVSLSLTLALVFEDLSTRLSDTYELRAEKYREQYEHAWNRLRFLYDADDNGAADDAKRRQGGVPTVWLAGR